MLLLLLKVIVDAPLCRRVNDELWERNCHMIVMYRYYQKQAYSKADLKRLNFTEIRMLIGKSCQTLDRCHLAKR